MSVKRWEPEYDAVGRAEVYADPSGKFVLYTDYAALLERCERMEKAFDHMQHWLGELLAEDLEREVGGEGLCRVCGYPLEKIYTTCSEEHAKIYDKALAAKEEANV